MLFWMITAALVALVAALMGLALLRGRSGAEPAAAYDLRVYRDQLKDVDRDLARGVIGAEEAERLRLEISRRVLEADRAVKAGGAVQAAPAGITLAAALGGVAVLAAAFGLYQKLGAPGYPDQPLAERIAFSQEMYDTRPSQEAAEAEAATARGPLPTPDPQFVSLMERLRKAVADRPNDTEGLALLARNEASLGNFREAWQAQRRLIAVKGDTATAADHAGLADLMILAAGGRITSEAEAVLAEVMARDPRNGTARYYIGLMMAQNGRPDRTFAIWRGLLEEGPETAPWIAPIRAGIEDLAWLAGETDYTPPAPKSAGPSAQDIATAAALAPEARAEKLRALVEGLNAQMATQGGTAQDWGRLLAGLALLGETERAAAIWGEATRLFAERPAEMATIRTEAEAGGFDTSMQPETRGPTTEQMRDAAQMSPEDRQAMIRGMVEGLAGRLETEGGSAAEWAQLIGALANLGETDRARAAFTTASQTFADQPDDLASITAAAQQAGVAE